VTHGGGYPMNARRVSRASEQSERVPQAAQTLDARGSQESSKDSGRSCEAGRPPYLAKHETVGMSHNVTRNSQCISLREQSRGEANPHLAGGSGAMPIPGRPSKGKARRNV
jgi:hypothetical protein